MNCFCGIIQRNIFLLKNPYRKKIVLPWMSNFALWYFSPLTFLFFYQSFLFFFFTGTDDLQDSKVREGTTFYSTLSLPPAHETSDTYLHLCMWDDYHVFLIATLMFTRLLLDDIYNLIELPIDWWRNVCLFTWWFDSRFLLQQFDMGDWWIWTRIDYHPCITSELTNQVC